ncbi:MAG: DM13 domain-containing protein [Cyanobacteria bacterium P01_A01_bin.3]
MGALSGLNGHTTSGNVSVAFVAGVGASLAIKNLQTDVGGAKLSVSLTQDGDMDRRTIDLGSLSGTEGSFDLELPDSADISVYNTVIVQAGEEAIAEGDLP